MSVSIDEIQQIWNKICQKIRSKDIENLAILTNEFHHKIESFRGYNVTRGGTPRLKDEDIPFFEPKITEEEILFWMSNSVYQKSLPWRYPDYKKGEKDPKLINPPAFDFDKFLSTFYLMCSKSGLEKKDLMQKFLNQQVDAIVAIKNTPGTRPTSFAEINSLFIKIKACLACEGVSLEYMRKAFADNSITAETFWEIGYDAIKIQAFVDELTAKGVIGTGNVAADKIDEFTQKLKTLESKEMFDLLATNPGKMLSKIAGNKPAVLDADYDEPANCVHASYNKLSECHCGTRFSRGVGNERNVSEENLVKILQSKGHNQVPRIGVVGSGGLYQVAVIVAKIFSNTELHELSIDLIDTLYLHQPSESKEQFAQFVKLLTDLGFTVRLASNARELHSQKPIPWPSGGNSRGTINLEIYTNKNADVYQNDADVFFMNDCQIKRDDLDKSMAAAKEGAILIAALHTQQKREAKFGAADNFCWKKSNGTWENYVPTAHSLSYGRS